MEYKLSPLAEKDIEKIFRYTLEQWGRKQLVVYQKLMTEAVQIACESPGSHKIKNRDELIKGIMSIRFGKHMIFFRRSENMVQIIRILHERMDFQTHLK